MNPFRRWYLRATLVVALVLVPGMDLLGSADGLGNTPPNQRGGGASEESPCATAQCVEQGRVLRQEAQDRGHGRLRGLQHA